MTREEAVIILDGFKNNPLFSDTHAQAFDMAISALSENKGFDGMTNGEVIQALFPNCTVEIVGGGGWVDTDIDDSTMFSAVWWNAPYQKGGEE